MNETFYLGVYCRRCEEMIPLVELPSGPNTHEWIIPRLPPFEAQCQKCGRWAQYRQRHLYIFESSLLDDVEMLPNFRYW